LPRLSVLATWLLVSLYSSFNNIITPGSGLDVVVQSHGRLNNLTLLLILSVMDGIPAPNGTEVLELRVNKRFT
jgi:hypothetical protein